MRKASWILLTIVGALIALGSLANLATAYVGGAELGVVGPTNFQELAAGRDDVEKSLRGQRGTAASFALAFAVLMLMVVVGPYRRGRLWAWWAILVAAFVHAAATSVRIILIGSALGVATAVIFFAVVVVALLLDFGRLSRPH